MRWQAPEEMVKYRYRYWKTALPAFFAGHTQAAPIEGELSSNAASLLVILGIGALLMGMRNLRELRHKRLMPERPQCDTQGPAAEGGESPVDD